MMNNFILRKYITKHKIFNEIFLIIKIFQVRNVAKHLTHTANFVIEISKLMLMILQANNVAKHMIYKKKLYYKILKH